MTNELALCPFRQPEKHCAKVGAGGVFAADACPLTCGNCPPEPECADDTTWFYKKIKNTCENYVSKKRKNCAKKDHHGVYAFAACAATCGTCA